MGKLKMDKYIIKGSGNIQDICKMLKVIQSIFGEGATLSEIDIKTRYNQMQQAIKKQIEKDDKKI